MGYVNPIPAGVLENQDTLAGGGGGHFSYVLFELFKIFLCTLVIKDRGINCITRDYGHCITFPYLNSNGKIIEETKNPNQDHG